MEFKESQMGGGKLLMEQHSVKVPVRQVYCFSLFSMLLALNQTHIDYFSLDVEGLELEILKTIPFDKIDISVLTVEYIHGEGGQEAYIDFMESKGYYKHSVLTKFKPEIYFGCHDIVFVKKGVNL